MNQQKSLMMKRNDQQMKLCQKIYKLASEMEKNKLIMEKRQLKEGMEKKKNEKKKTLDAIETFYKDRITLLKERINNEKFERKIAQQAQQEALSKMKKEINNAKKKEIEKYQELLKQVTIFPLFLYIVFKLTFLQEYDFQSTNMRKNEQEMEKMLRKIFQSQAIC